MEISSDNKYSVESFIKKAGEYSSTKGDLLKYKIIDRISDTSSEIISYVFIIVLFIPFFALLNIGICIWLGNTINSIPDAFFIMSGLYLLIAVIIALTRKKWIKPSLNNSIIKHSLK